LRAHGTARIEPAIRLIYLHQYFNTPEMSGSTRSYEIGRRLAAAGHQVDIVTSWQEPSDRRGWFTTAVAGMQVHWLPVRYSNHMGYAARLGAFCRFAWAAARRAASLPADVVFATSTPLTIALPAVYAARRLRVPMVFEVRDLWPELPIAVGALRNPLLRAAARRLERFAYANSSAVIALSPGMAQGVVRAGYDARKVVMVPNAADLDMFRRDAARGAEFRARLGIAPDRVLVAYVGTLGRINGVAYLAQVAAACRDDPRLSFLVVGDGLEREQVRALARGLGILDRNFSMLARTPKAEVPALLSAVDVATSLFLPIAQMEANSANKFFDALAAGCCVAINYGGWHQQLLAEHDAGLRLDADPAAAAAQLSALAADRGALRARGENARRLAEARFSRDDLASQVREVLLQAAAGGGA
jgi:glycosyltransferase involved in cell wall biosynthesis